MSALFKWESTVKIYPPNIVAGIFLLFVISSKKNVVKKTQFSY